MKFKYRYLRDSSGPRRDYIRLPLLQVQLGFEGNHTDIVGLVDTGATDCLFDRDVADDLGIKFADSDVTREYFWRGRAVGSRPYAYNPISDSGLL